MPPPPAAEPGLIHVKAEEYAFTAPPSFPSGWVKLRFDNQGQEPHFLIIWELPEGRTFGEYASEVVEPFGRLYAEYRSGTLDQAAFFEQLIAEIPEWFYSAVARGGPGFTSPGHTSETTIYLEPGGNYLMECYVRSATEGDTFHNHHGMLRPLIVTEEASGMAPPPADVEIALSSSEGDFKLEVAGDLSAGEHTARVRVIDRPEGFILHNVHLVRLEGEQTAADVAPWMDWVDAMLPPAPAVFLGGAGQNAAGGESYFSFELEPGRYAWISESFGVRGMVHEFSVE